MPLVGSFVLPHGALVLDEAKPIYSAELNRAMKQAAQDLVALRPDVVLLSTPHGIALDSDFGLYLNLAAKGSGKKTLTISPTSDTAMT
jgi:aromatic ring-opening dioxygenase LigB subunit